ncbi:threonine/serine exporter family protein [Cellulomonas xiejunii]|uniref:Threonine/serine exporter family protein n=1 Tax=Cellulomonas xiejunii TaxID=2968083 RepID=A0ABY5KRH2_9CELL|nr:threonine/serine exporter family protein [Cellulomonas xiejunii]MCC2321760.1 threonine/serine exporter family protein [Cellulomonas xiejunii]UUI73069.1 threonine/serine exporter family protein [Cellulomonas xiejunii]
MTSPASPLSVAAPLRGLQVDPQDVEEIQEVPDGATTAPAEPDVTTAPAPVPVEPTVDPATDAPVPPVDATPAPTPQVSTAPALEPTPTAVTGVPTSTPRPTSTSGALVQQWPSGPAVTESSLPWGTVLAAALVLVLAAAGIAWWLRRTSRPRLPTGTATLTRVPTATSTATPDGDDTPTLELPPLGAADTTLVVPPGASRADERVVGEPDHGGPDDGEVRDGVPHDREMHHGEPGEDVDALSARADVTVLFLVRLGEAMIDTGSPIVQVDSTLERVATVNGLPDAAVVTFPTALMVSVPQHDTVRTAVSAAGSRTLRLDQVADVLDLADAASRGDVRPREGLEKLSTIVMSEPTSSLTRRALGYVAVAAGLSLVLGGGWLDVLVAAVLGGVVAAVTTATRRVPAVYEGLLVALCAFVVAVPVLLLVRTGWPVGLLAPLVAPLVTFLPGALLTTGVIDLATRQMIAGSSRLAAGVMQLVLLALGITTAAGLVGVPAADVGTGSTGQPLGWFGPWVGVLVYAVGVVLNNAARQGSLPWITLVLLVAYAGQVIGGVLFGAVVSSFVGALAMTPVAMLAAARRGAPPFLVTFLPGFWVLVPGALGLVGVTSALGRSTDQAITTIMTTGISMVAISLGVLAGLALGGRVQRRFAPDAPRIV